ncbi:MAG TPA: DUF4442 domain-containing protein [Flavisolibacter sp.]|jgi:acyl-coenzyme A thioesterase PaaI-like protein|nr:DUF4442 domain-containing protein [Flavisolibacter sp.]
METAVNSFQTSYAPFFAVVRNPLKFRLFLLGKLPAAYFSGIRLQSITEDEAIVTIPYKWFTKNPFRSAYFACLSMAAEMSTGLLAMAPIYKSTPRVALLVVKVEGSFHKKATGSTRFVCRQGQLIRATIQEAIDTGEGKSIRVHSEGYNQAGELIAEFWITWSFKAKRTGT